MKKIGLLNLRGYMRVLGLLCRLWYMALYTLVYSIVIGIASVSVWFFKQCKRIVNTYPKTVLLIVCMAFALDHVLLVVSHRAVQEKQNIRFDSLAAMKDSIERVSSFDSGYAKGLVDGNQMLRNTDGLKQEKSIIHRP